GCRARDPPDSKPPPRSRQPALLGRRDARPAARSPSLHRCARAVTETLAPGRRVRRLFVGRPMQTGQLEETLLPKTLALPIFASDPLSSVAYATESGLVVLLAASGAA